jgi:hypothetical protein
VSTGAAVSDLDRERSAEARAVAEVQKLPLLLSIAERCTVACRDARVMAARSRVSAYCCILLHLHRCHLSTTASLQERNRHRLRIPRRPAWNRDMTAEQVEAQERDAFLAWRRDLARYSFPVCLPSRLRKMAGIRVSGFWAHYRPCITPGCWLCSQFQTASIGTEASYDVQFRALL